MAWSSLIKSSLDEVFCWQLDDIKRRKERKRKVSFGFIVSFFTRQNTEFN